MIRVLAGLLVLALLGAGVAWYSALQWFERPGERAETLVVEVPKGTSLGGVALQLAEAGLIGEPRLWSLLVRFEGHAAQLKAGEYEFSGQASPRDVMAQLVRGEVLQHRVALVEGWTVAQALRALRAHPALIHELPPETDTANLLSRLGLGDGSAEGRLLPETYQFTRGESDAAIARRAIAAMDAALAEAFAARDTDLPYRNPYQVLIVASLIEKETGRPEDRPLISQVFARRLKLGMRLQTDPSIIYGLGRDFDGNLTRTHLRTDGPYNSYTRAGLPPTPIALPGLAALDAAVHPAATDYLYFVARGDGSSEFSRTLAEHEAAVMRFQIRPARGGS